MNIYAKKFVRYGFLFLCGSIVVMFSCAKAEEISYEEAHALQLQSEHELLQSTVWRPGPPSFEKGKEGGEIIVNIGNDIKTLNPINTRDADTSDVLRFSKETLVEYDPYEKEFVPNIATFTVRYDEENDKTFVRYTLKEDIYWRTASGEKEPVTADDIIFWREEIIGEKKYNRGYDTIFIKTRSGERERIELKKIDDRTVEFIVPVVIANPLYYTNLEFGPKYKFVQLLDELKKSDPELNKDEDYRSILSLETDPRIIPSLTGYVMTEYKQGRYVRYESIDDPVYWKETTDGSSRPYVKTVTFRVVKEKATELLLFKQGELSSFAANISQLSELIEDMNKAEEDSEEARKFSIYNKGPNLYSSFIAFNQNPLYKGKSVEWFQKKKVRQALSRLLPREKIAEVVYSGLSSPAVYFFARQNKYFDDSISLPHTYDPEKAVELLKEEGFYYKDDGLLYDKDGEHMEFSINFGTGTEVNDAMANLYAQELKKVGITLNVRPLDFLLLVEKLMKTHQWDVCMVAITTATFFPESAPDVWLSTGGLHLWNPLQETPATEWEQRIDDLFYKGLYTKDGPERKAIYDEYQRIFLDQVPLTFITYNYTFTAARKNIRNVFLDANRGSILNYPYNVFIK